MTLFYISVGMMILIALALVLTPLWRPYLARSGAHDRTSLVLGLLMLLAIPVLAILIYSRVGGYQQVIQYQQAQREAKAVKAELAKIKNPQQLINQLQARLKQQPNSVQGWFLLGKLYLGLQQYPQASDALTKAYQLNDQRSDIIVALSEANFFINDHHLTTSDAARLAHVLQRDKKNVNALNLLAIDAYLQHHNQTAIYYWERLLTLFPAESSDSKTILQMIAKAQQHLKIQKQNKQNKQNKP